MKANDVDGLIRRQIGDHKPVFPSHDPAKLSALKLACCFWEIGQLLALSEQMHLTEV